VGNELHVEMLTETASYRGSDLTHQEERDLRGTKRLTTLSGYTKTWNTKKPPVGGDSFQWGGLGWVVSLLQIEIFDAFYMQTSNYYCVRTVLT
jgi:hypothetical protein